MPDAHSPATPPADDPAASTKAAPESTAAETPEAPAPEPWTAEKVSEWNRYYDIYVVLAVLLLAFLGSVNLVTQASLWTHLQAGRELSTKFDPTADNFSYTEGDHHWVHITWLSDLIHYQVYNLIAGFAPADATALPAPGAAPGAEPRPDPSMGEQWGAGGLTILDALVRAATVLVLLAIRRKGPGLWWSALCAGLALAVLPLPIAAWPNPIGLVIGGIGGKATVDSGPWTQLLLAIELLLLFRAFEQGKVRALYGLVPVFLLWANLNETFLFGLLVLAAVVAVPPRTRPVATAKAGTEPARPMYRAGLVALGVCAAACLVNPALFKVYPAALGSFVSLPGWSPGPMTEDQASFFSRLFTANLPAEVQIRRIYFLVIAGVGFASFVLNRRRFSLPRFLVYAVATALWALVQRYSTEFAVVFAVVLALNGQEWYQDRFGVEGRLGRGWALWSTGGRAVTLAALGLILVLRVVLGWGADPDEPQFGFGFRPGQFAFEAADLLRDAPIRGNVVNYWLPEGDALNWRAYPKRKTFIDSRRHLFSKDVVADWDALRKAIRDDDDAVWKPLLDKYDISVVMVDIGYAKNTYPALLNNRDWVRFYDDGDHALFGRGDAKAEDLAYFRRHELTSENLAYKNPEPAPSASELPSARSGISDLYRSGSRRANPHTIASARWMRPPDIAPDTPYLADPGRCLMAVREARKALVASPNEAAAYLRLAEAYSSLLTEETALIYGIEPTQANIQTLDQIPPRIDALPSRFRQLVTALRWAILTTPAPQTREERQDLAGLNLRLYRLYASDGAGDLARDCLDAWSQLADPADYQPQQYAAMTKQLTDLNAMLAELQRALTNLAIESQGGPLQKAAVARQRGAPGLAIAQLEEASQAGINPALIKPTLVDLYCRVGEADKALEQWTAGNSADPTLSDGPGTAAMRQGRVFFLVGNYDSALAMWNREALPSLRRERAMGAPFATRALLDGDPTVTTRTLIALPEQIGTLAMWEFEVGLASLEAGRPVEETAEHFTNALKLMPNMLVRPVIAYYLKKLGRPVPELPAAPAAKPAEPAKAGAAK